MKLIYFVLVGILSAGCAVKETVITDQQQGIQIPEDTYTVKKHDTLWAIAGKPSIYGDSFEWPLIFKTNRDQIMDPDLIYPEQTLKIKKDCVPGEISEAKKIAAETPKYNRHDVPGTQP
jgi:LysM repeat protein